ncbi:uncharacterized protein LOC135370241 isoform X2 [Ornithodoros turicata]|uniref:uncharacterized protein LOC135370241 isoform X2 n=1 Tax=Ornithodoros turicata TaxID=34597 RepID=UPI003138ED4F
MPARPKSPTVRQYAYKWLLSLGLYLIGTGVLAILIPSILQDNTLTAFLPLVFLSSDSIRTDSISPYYFSMSQLQALASLIIVVSVQSTSLYSRCAYKIIQHVGTRARFLLYSLVGMSFIAAFFLESLAAMLVLFAVCEKIVAVLKMDEIQRVQRKVLFDTATCHMPTRLRKNLQDYVLCEECALPEMEMPCDMDIEGGVSSEGTGDVPGEAPAALSSLATTLQPESVDVPIFLTRSDFPADGFSEGHGEQRDAHKERHVETVNEIETISSGFLKRRKSCSESQPEQAQQRETAPQGPVSEMASATCKITNHGTKAVVSDKLDQATKTSLQRPATTLETEEKHSEGNRAKQEKIDDAPSHEAPLHDVKKIGTQASARGVSIQDDAVSQRHDLITEAAMILPTSSSETLKSRRKTRISLDISRSPSPPPRKKPPPSQHCPEFLETFVKESVILHSIVTWKTSRYVVMQGHLMYGIVLLNVVASIVLPRSPSNTFFFEYASRTFNVTDIHEGKWLILSLPAALSAVAVAVPCLEHQLYPFFDAKPGPDAEREIREIIADNEMIMGQIRVPEKAPIVCFAIWLLRMSSVWRILTGESEPHLAIDYGLVVMLFLLPARLNEANDQTVINIISKLPWGAVLLIGSVYALKSGWEEIVEQSWIKQLLRTHLSGSNPLLAQFLLICTSCLFTEFISSVGTVSVLLPIVTELARDIPCHPMYLEVPLTLAASTTLILPTSSIAMALLYDMADVGPPSTVFPGLVVKATTAVVIALTTNFAGWYVFQWNVAYENNSTSINGTLPLSRAPLHQS